MVAGPSSEPNQTLPNAIITATSSGTVAMDSDSFGGNPFATALIESLGTEVQGMSDFMALLKVITEMQSHGKQTPDLLQVSNDPIVPISPQFQDASKIAMVMVYSDYSNSEIASLPGAEFDRKRIKKALEENGFECWTLIDPNDLQLEANLEAFSQASRTYDYSMIYVTGHGVEVSDEVYLLPSSYHISLGKTALETNALKISDLNTYQASRLGNFLLYGGCRNDPF